MRLPRDISGLELCKLLKIYGYTITRQKGSHIRLTTEIPTRHHITIPTHSPLKLGTLNSILEDISKHLGIPKMDISSEIFSK